MKTKAIIGIAFMLASVACDEETKPVDPIYEFIAFKGSPSISLNERDNSDTEYPLVIEMKAFSPYSEDIDVAFEIVERSASNNTDFTVSPAQSTKIRAGKFISDTIRISTIDNETAATQERSFDIRIVSVSKDDIKIGLGISEPKNATVTVNILDDECSETISVFNSSTLINTLDWGGGPVEKPATGVVTGNVLKVTGDLIDYGTFPNATISITLTPNTEGATKGTATFGEQPAGKDNDGWEYKFVQTGDGTYDVCSGIVDVAYDIYYLDGATWTYWYSVTNRFSKP